ncbi:FAD-dependent oxidoreductase [Sutterella massiliensis]|uniref:FAD-dependent oxidoreductase n=1 Tax=Sutterella massiliensis TaxID=1816689 RepID=A0ABS2DQV8_9BURK|nr:FAD-dependent oxidoreductase [Sutterella massiliensis]MBM6703674.1 FAD-dependent oxidoreductase [Sutterella massiliensis]
MTPLEVQCLSQDFGRLSRRTVLEKAARPLAAGLLLSGPLGLIAGCHRADDTETEKTAADDAFPPSGVIDDEMLAERIAEQAVKNDRLRTADLVIAGGGGAGLAAAARAGELGMTVILLEKMPELGGNTRIASGYYAAVDPLRQGAAGITDSPEEFLALLAENASPGLDPVRWARLRRLANDALPVMRWLEGLGVRFSNDVLEISGSLFPRTYKPLQPNGEGYIRQLAAAALRTGAVIRTHTAAESLVTSPKGRVLGVRARTRDGRTIEIHANRGVLVASGGFAASRDMIARFAPRYADLTHDNAPGITGEMLLAAARAGAQLVDMDEVQCQPGCPPGGTRRVRFHNDVNRFIFLDRCGRRFAAEDGRRDMLRDKILALPDAMAYALVDDDGFRSYNRLIQREAVLGVESGDAWVAETLSELAGAVGFEPDILEETVQRYNRGIADGRDAFGKHVAQARPIVRSPYWLAPAAMSVHATSGGIFTDENACALDKDGRPIPGLWAAGEAAGGLHGPNQLGGCGLADAFVFGRAAADSILRAG